MLDTDDVVDARTAKADKEHVILVAYYYPPSGGIGGVRPYRFYKYLKQLGHTVDVITATPQTTHAPDVFEIPDECGKRWQSGEKRRLDAPAAIERLIRASLLQGQLGVLWSLDVARYSKILLDQKRTRNVIVLTTFPPIGTFFAGLLISLREKIPWILDYRDPLGACAGPGVPRRGVVARRFLESLGSRYAAAVIANTEQAAARLRKLYPAAAARLEVVSNGFDPEDRLEPRYTPGNEKVLLHAGSLYGGRNPNLVIESLFRLRASGAPEALDTSVVLVGAVVKQAGLDEVRTRKAVSEGWLRFVESVPNAEARRRIEEAGRLLLLQPHTRTQVPAKLFEYVQTGRPILAVVPRSSSVENVLERSGVPYACLYPDAPPEEVDRNLAAFLSLNTEPTTPSATFEREFNSQLQTRHVSEIICRRTHDHRGRIRAERRIEYGVSRSQ